MLYVYLLLNFRKLYILDIEFIYRFLGLIYLGKKLEMMQKEEEDLIICYRDIIKNVKLL